MAVYYFRNTGSTDWGTASNWSLTDGGGATGLVPTVADDAYFTSNSGNCTISVSSVCKTLVCAGVGAGNYSGTLTINNLLEVYGNFTLSATMTIAGVSQIGFRASGTLTSAGLTIPNGLLFGSTSSLTYTLADNWVVNGAVSIGNTGTTTINGNQMTFNSSLNIGAALATGTTNFLLAGTGALQGTGTFRNNTTINTAGTITIGSATALNLNYNTGTFTYVAGTVNMFSSSVRIICSASTTLNTVGIIWPNATFSGAATITLTSNMTISGGLIIQTGAVVVNGVSRTLYVGGNLTVNQTTSGTASIELTGPGTWSSTGFNLSNNLIFNNGASSFTVSGSVYYTTGTMTYTSGTIVTTGSTLFTGTCTLNTNGINWVNLSATSATVTMTSNLNITGTFSNDGNVTFTSSGGLQLVTSGPYSVSNNATSPSGCTITLPNTINVTNMSASVGGNLNASVTVNGTGINISGNLTVTANNYSYALRGTASLNMVGTGTINSVNISGGSIYNPININTTGTITLGTYFNTGSVLTYIQGTFVTTNSSVWIRTGSGFDLIGFNNIYWDSDIRTGFDVFTPNYTLSSNLNCRSFNAGGVCTAIGPGVINCNSLSINNNVSAGSNIANVFNTDVNVYGTATIGTGGTSFVIGTAAGKAINVYGDLVLSAPNTIYGDATVKMLGTGTITSVANFRQFDLIIDTPGNITIANILYWNTGATAIAGKGITYLRGNVIVPKSAGLYLGNLNATFTNMHRIPWPTVTITAGQTITLNEFFSGTANYKTIVQSTSTSPYTISFTDGFEKTTKFVEISNCTLTRPNQLIVAGDCKAKGTNRGIRYTNQSPNGLPKNLAKTKPSMTFDTGGLVPDPNFIRLK